MVGRCMSADAPVGESGSDDILGAIETAVDRDDSHGAPQPNWCRQPSLAVRCFRIRWPSLVPELGRIVEIAAEFNNTAPQHS